ncbi:hypothetical protein [Mammaliicoccus lentus]|uniref:hypothetical protein n=1 Tax=Mammaliicoccus lentus TaxID=42858 RepID=UPI00107198ED|nr:hypothetical protein [Mammaliicoccus lentus]MBF0795232.1 hypothetical protein [Mammaliicoccus lentus]TFV14628.1 hypothetical protein E4T78_11225 [Mammaliicoccus lentus]
MEITPEIQARLKENDIPEHTFEKRLYKGESIEEASTRPVQKKTLDEETKKILEKNGIKYTTYWQRINRGMSHEKAISQPVQARPNFSEKEKEIMKENGVSERLARRRLRYPNWSRKDALSLPPNS